MRTNSFGGITQDKGQVSGRRLWGGDQLTRQAVGMGGREACAERPGLRT